MVPHTQGKQRQETDSSGRVKWVRDQWWHIAYPVHTLKTQLLIKSAWTLPCSFFPWGGQHHYAMCSKAVLIIKRYNVKLTSDTSTFYRKYPAVESSVPGPLSPPDQWLNQWLLCGSIVGCNVSCVLLDIFHTNQNTYFTKDNCGCHIKSWVSFLFNFVFPDFLFAM